MNPYKLYHPKWYRKRVSTWWWVSRWKHLRFILREISSVFVAWFAIVILLLIRALSIGPRSYAEFLEWMKSPSILALNIIAFFFVLYHAITWFNLAPKAMPIKIGSRRLSPWMIAMPNYILWLIVSVIIIGYVLDWRMP